MASRGWGLSDDDNANEEPVRVESAASHAAAIARAPEADSLMATLLREARSIQREPQRMLAEAKDIGSLLGEDGFYRFPVGDKTVEGPSVNMAQALASSWGGMANQVHIVESQPTAAGGLRIHFRARSMDLRSLVAAEVDGVVSTSAPPSKFAGKPEQRERWHAMQTQSAASKMIRNAILDILPAWFVEAAMESAIETDSQTATNGKPLPEARMTAVGFLSQFGVTREECEQAVGKPVDLWATPQLAILRNLSREFARKTLSIEQFRADLATASEKAQQATATPSRTSLGLKADAPPPATPPPPAATPAGPTATAGPPSAGGDGSPAASPPPPASVAQTPAQPPPKPPDDPAAEAFEKHQQAAKRAGKGGAT